MDNADFNVTSWVYQGLLLPGTEVEYTCDEGYLMAPMYYMGRVCGADGNYNALSTNPEFATGVCIPGSVKLISPASFTTRFQYHKYYILDCL